jgi:hypothetical protein
MKRAIQFPFAFRQLQALFHSLMPQKTLFSLHFCGCMREAEESSEEISAAVGKTQRSFFAVRSYEAKK